MTTKRLLTTLIICIVIAGGMYYGIKYLMSSLSGTAAEELSSAELSMVSRLENTYACSIKVVHFSKNIQSATTMDSTVKISFYWKTKDGEEKDTVHNIAIKDDNLIIPFSREVVETFIKILPNRQYYSHIDISFEDVLVQGGRINETRKKTDVKYMVTPNGTIELIDFNNH